MGIRCCTPIMTNIFRRHSPPHWVLWLCVWVAFLYSNPFTEKWLTISFEGLLAVFGFCWLTQFPWKMAREGGTVCHHKNINGKLVCSCWVMLSPFFWTFHWWKVMWTQHSSHHPCTDCLLSARYIPILSSHELWTLGCLSLMAWNWNPAVGCNGWRCRGWLFSHVQPSSSLTSWNVIGLWRMRATGDEQQWESCGGWWLRILTC